MTEVAPLTPIAENLGSSDIDADPVVEFMASHIQRKVGVRVAWDILYEWFSSEWADGPGTSKPLSAAEFGAALAFVCERASIRVAKKRGRVFCLHVHLIDPGVKALPAPGQGASPQT